MILSPHEDWPDPLMCVAQALIDLGVDATYFENLRQVNLRFPMLHSTSVLILKMGGDEIQLYNPYLDIAEYTYQLSDPAVFDKIKGQLARLRNGDASTDDAGVVDSTSSR